ncbi:MAG: flagellar biosynthesis protein FliQ [Proteobacteria bacterium]|nr:flagellar biosynthesis protein FliQ [Pseudomonadota bacterium]MBU1737650.1 flagellar biosynthesis protein FliQ [Pseudomonadota bacterium]
MTPIEVVSLSQDAVKICLMISAPLLIVGMVVGIIIALFQATTQIQEMTLTFVPKIVAIMMTLLFFSSWMMTTMIDYTENLINSLPMIIR